MTVPVNIVINDHVYKIIANGCSSIKIPAAIRQDASISIGPRRSHLGQPEAGVCVAAAGVEGGIVDINYSFSFLLAHRAKGNPTQQMLSHQDREDQDRCQEQGCPSRHSRPVLTTFANDDWDEGWRSLRCTRREQHR